MNEKISAALAATFLCTSAISAVAQDDAAKDMPISTPPNAVVKSSGGLYVWGAGGPWALSQQRAAEAAAGEDGGSTVTRTAAPSVSDLGLPVASSATTRSAIGYVLPPNTLGQKWGKNVRAEFGVEETTANMPLASGAENPQFYNGVTFGGCSTCSEASTNYSSRKLSAKAASDYKFDSVTLTPSVTVFSSRSHQEFIGDNGSPALEWNDLGAKLGVEAKVDLTSEVAIGVGGSYGIAQRSVAMSSDANAASDSAFPHLASGKAKFTYQPADELSFNGYAGIGNYDNKVPGVAGTAGAIDYAPATNIFYGAAATYRFGTR